MDRTTPIQSEIDLSSELQFWLADLLCDPAAHEVRFAGSSERLQPQPMKVLVALARRRGVVAYRSDLIATCWGGRVVGEDVINRAILVLRGLGRRSGAFSIETVPKAGYKLVDHGGERKRALPKWLMLAAAALLIAAACLFALVKYLPAPSPATRPVSIAVLPPESSDDSIARSLSAAIRNSLLHMLGDSGLPAQSAANLQEARSAAEFILSSDVRRQNNAVTVTLHLEEAADRVVLLSKVFRSDIRSVDSLADQVGAYAAANLSWAATYDILKQTADRRLKGELLKQLFLTVEGEDALRAYEMSEQLAAKAPDSTMAQLGLAHNSGLVLAQLSPEERPEAINRARAAARKSQQLAPDFGDVYTPMCLLYPTSWQAFCEDYLLLALRRDPQSPYAAAYLRRYLGEVGRNREATRYARMSLANDPYKPGKLGGLVGRLEATGQPAEAAKVFADAIRWWPRYRILYLERLNGMAQRGDLNAVAEFARNSSADQFPVDPSQAIALAAAVNSGSRAGVRSACASASRENALGPLCLIALTRVGDFDEAFRIARILYPARVAATREEEDRLWVRDPVRFPTAFLSSPALAPLRRDPRFLPLAESLGLLRYWRSGRLPDFCAGTPEPVCASFKRSQNRRTSPTQSLGRDVRGPIY